MPVYSNGFQRQTKRFPFIGNQLRHFFSNPAIRGKTYDRLVTVEWLSKTFLDMRLGHIDDLIITAEDEELDIFTPYVESILFAVSSEHQELARLTWRYDSPTTAGDIFDLADPAQTRYLCAVVRVVWLHPSFSSLDRWSISIHAHLRPPGGIAALLSD